MLKGMARLAPVCLCLIWAATATGGETKTKTHYGHDARYTRIAGQLIWRELEGGHWQIQIVAPKDPQKAKHPRFTLGKPEQLKGFKHGEWVEITGHISKGQIGIWMTGTLYTVKTVKRLGPAPKPKDDVAWKEVVGKTPAYQKLEAKEIVLRGEFIVKNYGKPGVMYLRTPQDYYLETRTRTLQLGPAPSFDGLADTLAKKTVEVKGKIRPMRAGSKKKFFLVGWIREVKPAQAKPKSQPELPAGVPPRQQQG